MITGEAGVGKSRLVQEFSSMHRDETIHLFVAGCSTYVRSRPLELFTNLLRSIIRQPISAFSHDRRQALQDYLTSRRLSQSEVASQLELVLGLSDLGNEPTLYADHVDSFVSQKLLHAAIRQVIVAEATIRPLVIVLEDLHWIDLASRSLLQELVSTIEDIPLMVIMISRSVERQTVIQPLLEAVQRRANRFTDMRLYPLSSLEGHVLVSHLLEISSQPAESVKQKIVERAEGNPLFAEEIIRLLLYRGGLVRSEGTWTLTSDAHDLLSQIPASVSALIQARFDQLTTPVRRLLQRAAVLGTTFPLSLLEQISEISDSDLSRQLKELEFYQFLIPAHVSGELGYAFRHALIQESVYDTLLERDRRRIHSYVANSILERSRWPADTRAEAVAYHYFRGEEPSKAIPFTVEAGDAALRRGAHEIALHHYQRAYGLSEEESLQLNQELVYRAKIGIGQCKKLVGQYQAAGEILKEVTEELTRRYEATRSPSLLPMLIYGLRELADTDVREGNLEQATQFLEVGLNILGDGATAEHSVLWQALIERLAWVRFRQARMDEAFTLASSVAVNAQRDMLDTPIVIASLYNTLGGIFWHWGNLQEAAGYVSLSLKIYERIGYAWGEAIAFTNLGVLNYVQGRWEEASGFYQRAYQIRQDNGYISELPLTLNNIAMLNLAMGQHEHARKDLLACYDVARGLKDEYGIVLANIGLAQLAIVVGQHELAWQHLQEIEPLLENAGDYQAVHARWLTALAVAGRGDLGAGIEMANQALDMSIEAGLNDMEANCRRVLGILYRDAEQWRRAEILLQESVELCSRSSMPYERGLAQLEIGRLFMAEARFANAAQSLKEATKAFERLGARYDLDQTMAAQNQLQQLSANHLTQAKTLPQLADSKIQGENRYAYIVWLGFQAQNSLGEEAVFEMYSQIYLALIDVVSQHQAQLIRRKDGATIIIGALTNFDDDAERAIQVAQRSEFILNQHLDVLEPSRIVVHAGNIIAGQPVKEMSEVIVTGEPLTVASSLCELVPQGAIWITDPVRLRTSYAFEFESPPVQIPEVMGDLSLWRLIGVREIPAQIRGLPDLKTRLIGREQIMAEMTHISENLSDGFGGLIWIEGAPGIGKSRLMNEFIQNLDTSRYVVWDRVSATQRSRQAFSLFTELFRRLLEIDPRDTHEQMRQKIERSTRIWPPDIRAMQPYLELLLGIQPEDEIGRRLADLEPEQLRQQLFVVLRRFLKVLAGQSPLILLLDDLHWIDSVSAELLLFLIPLVASDPILFVCAQRRQGGDAPNDRAIRSRSLMPTQTLYLQLDRLSESDSDLLLNELIMQAPIASEVRNMILKQSEGNPFFIEEYVRMLIEQGYLTRDGDEWQVSDAHLVNLEGVPATLETLILSRTDALPTDLREVIQYASVLGPTFHVDILQPLCPHIDVNSALKRLMSRLLLHPGVKPKQWRFYHSVIESVVYNAMLAKRREEIHRQIAHYLETSWAGMETEHAVELAHHFMRAQETEKALSYQLIAAEQAASKFANEEAVGYFEVAFDLLHDLNVVAPEARWRVVTGLGDTYRDLGHYGRSEDLLASNLDLVDEQSLSVSFRAGLLRRLGNTVRKQGDLDRAEAHFRQALDILETPSTDEEQREAATIWLGLAWTQFARGTLEDAMQSCEQCIVHANTVQAINELAGAENLAGGIHYRQGDWEQASHRTTRAMILRDKMGYSWGVASTLNNLGILSVTAGQWSQARSFFERSLVLRNDLGDVEGATLTHNNIGTLARDQGELDTAEEHFQASLKMATTFNLPFHIANSAIGLAQVMLCRDDPDAARAIFNEHLVRVDSMNAANLSAEAYRVLAEIHRASASLADADSAIQSALELIPDIRTPSLLASLFTVAASIKLGLGESKQALDYIKQAQAVLEDTVESIESGRVSALAGRLYLETGDILQARSHLQVAHQIFLRLGANLDRKHVEQDLERCQKAE
jgi:predicted ATPase/Tfp pilus assembly protein PilF